MISTGSTRPAGNHSTATGWWLVVVLFLTAVVSYTDRLVLSVLVDPLRVTFGLSDVDVSLLQGPAFTVIYVCASLVFGRLADRGRRKVLLLAGASGWCLATALCALAPDFRTLFEGRLLIGIAEATLIPTAVSLISDSFPPQRRGTAIGLFAMGTAVGGPFGISVGGLLLRAAEGGAFAAWPILAALAPWRVVLAILGVAGLSVPLLLMTVREPARIDSAREASVGAAVRHFVLDRRVLVPLYLAMGLLSIGDYGLVSWVPTALSRRFGWQADQVGVAFGVITGSAAIAGALCGGWFSDVAEHRGGKRARLALCGAIACVAAIGAGMISGGYSTLVLAGLGGWIFASTVSGVGGLATLQELVPNHYRGTAASVLTFCNTLFGLGCGPTLVALTTHHVYGDLSKVGYSITTIVAPAGALACALFLLSCRALRATSTPRARYADGSRP